MFLVVKLLLKNGADKSAMTSFGDTPGNVASLMGHDDVVERMEQYCCGVCKRLAKLNCVQGVKKSTIAVLSAKRRVGLPIKRYVKRVRRTKKEIPRIEPSGCFRVFLFSFVLRFLFLWRIWRRRGMLTLKACFNSFIS